MGSANINDRSQKGDGDSEIAVVVEDTDQIQTTIDGRPVGGSVTGYTVYRLMSLEHRLLVRCQPIRRNSTKKDHERFANQGSSRLDPSDMSPSLEHLGLIPPQFCETGKEPVTSFMRAVPYPSEDETQSNEDQLVADPLSDQFLDLWDGTARKNRQIFGEIFKTVPTDVVRNWDQYKVSLPSLPAPSPRWPC